MFKVLADFADLKDKNFKYHAGDVFPRQGYNPSAGRIAELLSGKNKRGRAVIAEVKEDPVEQAEPVEEKPVKQRGRRRNA